MNLVRITFSAFEAIKAECLRRNTETGGLLIGTAKESAIVRATVPGAGAELAMSHFRADVEEDQRQLDLSIRQSKGKLKNLGYWHLHPGGYSSPSQGDLAQARELVKGHPGNEENAWILVLIANVVNTAGPEPVALYGYCIAKGDVDFSAVQLLVVDDDADEIKSALAHEPAMIVPQDTDYWSDPEFQFYATGTGRTRLVEDMETLTAVGYSAQGKRATSGQSLFIDASKNGLTFRCFLPAEYPLNPPRIVWLPSGQEIKGLATISGWNSDCDLASALGEIEKRIVESEQRAITELRVVLKRGGQRNENRFVKRAFPTFVTVARAIGNGACITVWGGPRNRGPRQCIPIG